MKLGRVNVDAMLRSLTAKQFQEWEEYAGLEPLETDRRADWRTALIVKQIFDANQRLINAVLAGAGLERHKRPRFVETELKDFVLQWEEADNKNGKRRKQTWQEQWTIIEMINDAFGGTRH